MGMKSEGDNITCDCGFSFQRGHSGKHECADGLRAKLAAAVRREESLKASTDVLAQRVKDLEAAAIVPGVLRCAKCNYELMKTNLYFNSGTVGPGDSETEPCPNGCGPLWPVNWHAWAITGFAEAEKYHAQLQAAERRLQQPIPEILIDSVCHTAAEIYRARDEDKAQDIINRIREALEGFKVEGEWIHD
ncbi:hypothetical protein NJH77_24225 [Serratia fonticola]|uniref:hypothetical protein n=1 Tax=Serratia fonticola TaxID=47917 RepID=UPI002096934C|nr:hypothetical protein [Serratia fonticola]MCO7512359.1 hypothetical protein [Serratia fonticola]